MICILLYILFFILRTVYCVFYIVCLYCILGLLLIFYMYICRILLIQLLGCHIEINACLVKSKNYTNTCTIITITNTYYYNLYRSFLFCFRRVTILFCCLPSSAVAVLVQRSALAVLHEISDGYKCGQKTARFKAYFTSDSSNEVLSGQLGRRLWRAPV